MKRLVIASNNKGKIAEIKNILSDLPVEVVSMGEAGYETVFEEKGSSFRENAVLKARMLYEESGEMVLADDSGLEIDFLNGAPGVYTARFAGENTSQAEKNNRIIQMMEGVETPYRTARFVCCVAFVSKNISFETHGTIEGIISEEPAGNMGFGYDPVFYLPEYEKTFAQLPEQIKNKISHRARALNKFRDRFLEIYNSL